MITPIVMSSLQKIALVTVTSGTKVFTLVSLFGCQIVKLKMDHFKYVRSKPAPLTLVTVRVNSVDHTARFVVHLCSQLDRKVVL